MGTAHSLLPLLLPLPGFDGERVFGLGDDPVRFQVTENTVGFGHDKSPGEAMVRLIYHRGRHGFHKSGKSLNALRRAPLAPLDRLGTGRAGSIGPQLNSWIWVKAS